MLSRPRLVILPALELDWSEPFNNFSGNTDTIACIRGHAREKYDRKKQSNEISYIHGRGRLCNRLALATRNKCSTL